MIPGKGVPVDWTGGTGVVSAGGTISVTAEPHRTGWRIQNLDTTALSVQFACTTPAGASATGTLVLAPAGSTGAAGGLLDSGTTAAFVTNEAFNIVGTAGSHLSAITY